MNMKREKFFTFMIMALLMVVCAPGVKVQAEVTQPATPSGLGLYSQKGNEFILTWDVDNTVIAYASAGIVSGYEVEIQNLKGKTIVTESTLTNTSDFGMVKDSNKIGIDIKNSKLKKAGFQFVVRSFIYDENNLPVYSADSEKKIIIPRATIKSRKLAGSGKVKITWQKISKAKSYTVYISSNDGKKYKKVGTTSSTSIVIPNLKKYTDYYVYVTANKVKCGKKKYNSTKPTEKNSNRKGFYIYTTAR
jgi:hypothetical protein